MYSTCLSFPVFITFNAGKVEESGFREKENNGPVFKES